MILDIRVFASRLGNMQGILVTGRLLRGSHDGIEVGREAAFEERQVASVFETLPQQVRRNLPRSSLQISLIILPGGEQQLLHAVDREVFVVFQLRPRPFVKAGNKRQLAEEEEQRAIL